MQSLPVTRLQFACFTKRLTCYIWLKKKGCRVVVAPVTSEASRLSGFQP